MDERSEIITKDRSIITQICHLVRHADHVANARLIAAAPEMLQALRVAVSVLRDSPRDIDKAALIEIRTAIAKAEGK